MNLHRLRRGTRLALAALLLCFTVAMPALASGRLADATRQGVGRSDVVDAGAYHACAVRGDGSVGCWGDDSDGRATSPAGRFLQVTGGRLHTCGVRSDGSGACWGRDFNGSISVPAGRYRQLDTSFLHTCGINDAGGLACWGNNGNGQSAPPAGVFSQVSAGYYHSCAIRDDGNLACWGFTGHGASTPPAGRFVAVSSGSFHSCGVREDGAAVCWGDNGNGQTTAPAGSFAQISSFNTGNCGLRSDGTAVCWGAAPAAPAGVFVEVDAGDGYACGLRENGNAECWGDNAYGQAAPPAGGFGFGAISAGIFHGCTLRADGNVGCWGSNASGETVPPAGLFVQAQAGYHYSCGVRADGSLTCWGTGLGGQGTPPTGSFLQVMTGLYHACAVRTDTTLACWGEDYVGQASPPAGSFVQVSGSFESTCAVRADGGLSCWGANYNGQSTPPAGSFVEVTSGFYHHCGLRTDGTVACWGSDSLGQAAPPAGTFRQISANGDATCGVQGDGALACWGLIDQASMPNGRYLQVSTGYQNACAIREDGVRVCWGRDSEAQSPRPTLQPASLPDGNAGAAYSQSLVLLDDNYAVVTPAFAVTSGSLPAGLSLTADGELSGTPTTGGNFAFTIEGEDANGFAASRDYTVAIIDDTSAPVIVPSVTGTLGDNGWYIGDVTVSWTVTDAESAITSTTGCATSTLSSDSIGAGFVCTATSAGGTASQSVTVKRDTVLPETAITASPSDPSDSADASFAFGGSDDTAGVASFECALDTSAFAACTSAQVYTGLAEGSHTFQVRSVDAAGLADDTPATYTWIVDTDDTAPVIVPVVVGVLGDNGWYVGDVSIGWSVSDAESTVSSTSGCDAVVLAADTAGTSYTCTATSIGGTASETVTVKRDATAPVIAASATTAANAAGWYRTNVTVAFACQDALSGVVACAPNQVLSTEGNAVSSTAVTIVDQAGNTSAPSNVVTVRIDKTAPALAPSVSPNPLLLNAVATAAANGSDTLSGVATQSCVPLVTATVGIKATACAVTDLAGNSTNANANYRVVYGFTGFEAPVRNRGGWNRIENRLSIPFTWRAHDASGAGVTGLRNVRIVRSAIACPTSRAVPIVPLASYGGQDPRLQDLGGGRYRRDYGVLATHGSCAEIGVDLGDGVIHTALFKVD